MEEAPQIKSFDWLSAGQFAFSLLAVFSLIFISLFSLLAILFGGAVSDLGLGAGQVISSLLFTAGLGFAGILLIPSIIYSGRRLFGNRLPVLSRRDKMIWLGHIFPVPILFGYLIQNGPTWGQYLLPFVHVLANGASII